MKFLKSLAINTSCILLSISSSVSAQTIYMHDIPENKTKFGVKYLHPNFKLANTHSRLSGNYDIYTNIPVTDGINLQFCVPIVHYSNESYVVTDIAGHEVARGYDENTCGNIYIGIQHYNPDAEKYPLIASFGVYFPFTNKNKPVARAYGASSEVIGFQKYLPEYLAFLGNFAIFKAESKTSDVGLTGGIEAGSCVYLPTGEHWHGMDFSLHYGITVGLAVQHMVLSTELTGIVINSPKYGEDIAVTDSRLAFGIGVTDFIVRPSVFYQVPLDSDTRDFLDNVFGIKLEIAP